MADNKNTPKPKPIAPKPVVKVEAKVEEVKPEVLEVVEVVEEAPVVFTPADEYTETVVVMNVPTAQVPATAYAVVSNDSVDTVHVSKCIPHNVRQKKSLSVHHLQRRLNEWGFTSAYLDKDGYCGDNTLLAITQFQKAQGMFPVTGLPDYDTLSRVFEGDTNVKLVP